MAPQDAFERRGPYKPPQTWGGLPSNLGPVPVPGAHGSLPPWHGVDEFSTLGVMSCSRRKTRASKKSSSGEVNGLKAVLTALDTWKWIYGAASGLLVR